MEPENMNSPTAVFTKGNFRTVFEMEKVSTGFLQAPNCWVTSTKEGLLALSNIIFQKEQYFAVVFTMRIAMAT